MLTTVRLNPEGHQSDPFHMVVTGANHCINFEQRFSNHGDVWNAARRVGEAECDWLTRDRKGWSECPGCDGSGYLDTVKGAEAPVCLECGGGS